MAKTPRPDRALPCGCVWVNGEIVEVCRIQVMAALALGRQIAEPAPRL